MFVHVIMNFIYEYTTKTVCTCEIINCFVSLLLDTIYNVHVNMPAGF